MPHPLLLELMDWSKTPLDYLSEPYADIIATCGNTVPNENAHCDRFPQA